MKKQVIQGFLFIMVLLIPIFVYSEEKEDYGMHGRHMGEMEEGHMMMKDGHKDHYKHHQKYSDDSMHQKYMWRSHGDAEHILKLEEELGLSEEQITELKGIKKDSEIKRIKALAELKISKVELYELLHKKAINKAEIDNKLTTLGTIKTELERIRVFETLDSYAILTDAQKEVLKKNIRLTKAE